MVEGSDELLKRADGLIDGGEWENAWALLSVLLPRAEGAGDEALIARVRRRIAYVEAMRGRFPEAVTHYSKALETVLRLKDRVETAECLRGLGFVHWRKGDYNMAAEYFNQGLERAAETGDDVLRGRFLVELGNVMSVQGRLDAAERLYKEAISLLDGSEGVFDHSRALNNLGDLYMERKDFVMARGILERTVELCRSRKDLANLPWALLNLAETDVMLGEVPRVHSMLSEAARIMEDTDDRMGLAAVKRVRGMAASAIGNTSEAVEHFEAALKEYRRMGLPAREAVVLRLYGRMMLEKGDRRKGMVLLRDALGILEDIGASSAEILELRAILDDEDW